MRRWRMYLWPSIAFAIGVALWPVSVFFTNSTLHMLAHASWAEVAMLAGAVQLALVRGKLTSRWWTLSLSFTLLVSAAAFLIHEQNPWLFSRAAFLHHAIGWTLLVAAIFPLGQVLQPRRVRLERRVRDDVDRARRDAVLRPRRGSDLRPPLRVRRRHPMRHLLVVAIAALAFPGAASAHASLIGSSPADAVAARCPATSDRASLRPGGDDDRPGDRGVLGDRAQDVGRRGESRRRAHRPRSGERAAARRVLHGALARDLLRRSHGLRVSTRSASA